MIHTSCQCGPTAAAAAAEKRNLRSSIERPWPKLTQGKFEGDNEEGVHTCPAPSPEMAEIRDHTENLIGWYDQPTTVPVVHIKLISI